MPHGLAVILECRRWRMEVSGMVWETPTFTEVRMDAEMTAYQDDFDGI